MNNPKISVIIPNYNYARYLDQRIQSVLNQTYQDFEVIILDDCSTDNSLEVINKYRDNPHISQVVVNDVNSGSTFKQWNKGFHLAKGELIWIAESDDFCTIDMLERLVSAFIKKKNNVLAYSSSVLVDESGRPYYAGKIGKNQYFSGKYYLRHYLSLGCIVGNASSAIFSREAALTISERYMTIPAAGDYLFWVELVAQGHVAIVNQNLNYWRRHIGSVTEKKTADGTNLIAEKEICKRISEFTYISCTRKRLMYAYRALEISNIVFEREETKNMVMRLWDADKYMDLLSRCLLKIAKGLRNRYNYYI